MLQVGLLCERLFFHTSHRSFRSSEKHLICCLANSSLHPPASKTKPNKATIRGLKRRHSTKRVLMPRARAGESNSQPREQQKRKAAEAALLLLCIADRTGPTTWGSAHLLREAFLTWPSPSRIFLTLNCCYHTIITIIQKP